MRLLDRLRPAPDRVEVDVLAVVGGLVLGPDRLHRLDALAHQREAAVRIGAVVLHLLAVPTRADAEQEAPARQPVDARDLLRRDDRVALDHEADAGRDSRLSVAAAAAVSATNGSYVWLYSGGARRPAG